MVANDARKTFYYNFGDCHLDISKRRLLKKGKPIDLAQKTFDILCFLVENHGEILTKEQFFERFWDREFLEEGILTQQIYKIRKAIKNESSGETYIETVNMVGYRFVGEVFEETNLNEPFDLAISKQKTTKEEIKKSGIPYELLKSDKESRGYFNTKKSSLFFQNKLLIVFVGALLTIGLVSYYYLVPAEKNRLSSVQSIVILPFEQIGDTENEKLELGLADILISKFINQTKLYVPPTSTILKFSDKERKDIVEIGRKLEVDAVLTGTIQSDMGTARVNIQLIDVERGVPIWANKFDTEFSDIFSLQDEISQRVIKNIPVEFIKMESKEYLVNKQTNVSSR